VFLFKRKDLFWEKITKVGVGIFVTGIYVFSPINCSSPPKHPFEEVRTSFSGLIQIGKNSNWPVNWP
jgi:hypothetical protein